MALRTKLSAKVVLLLLYQIILLGAAASQQCTGDNSIKGKMLKGFTFQKMKVSNPSECYEACNNQIRCQSFNYVISQDMCELNNCTKEITQKDLERDPQRYFFQVKRQPKDYKSCTVLRNNPETKDGNYKLQINSVSILAYCDMTADGQGWTLIARFSNKDSKYWMKNDGSWWYDKTEAAGDTTDPSSNTDMISPAFWLVSGRELKITRSDDPQHTALLQTTDDCVGGQSFRSKITSYGNFRHGKVWASSKCRGSCTIQYGGQYRTTSGFSQASCNGNIQSAKRIGFWCDWSSGGGAVMMIGGGGSSCARADHGIGITEDDAASFNDYYEQDFGNSAYSFTNGYSLNLWIR